MSLDLEKIVLVLLIRHPRDLSRKLEMSKAQKRDLNWTYKFGSCKNINEAMEWIQYLCIEAMRREETSMARQQMNIYSQARHLLCVRLCSKGLTFQSN